MICEMPEISLKHYEKYITKLVYYAKALQIKVVVVDDLEPHGLFIPLKKKILISSGLSESSEIATLLHELGHCLDDAFTDLNKVKVTNKAYTAMYKGKSNKKQNQVIMDCEEKAWQYGRGIAKQLGIRLGKWYTKAEKSCLNTYREN